ncbi:MAG: P-loop NTPase [Nitrospiraceae bacterium]|nr:MAG: P-loop NTPase [Nitrospiraceae bacterium]
MMNSKKRKIIFSVGGGKGGVGKSIFSVSLGTALAKDGYRTVLADLDLGAANLHTYLGIVSETPTIADFILKKTASLEELLMETSVRGLNLISGAEFVPGMANPAHWMKLKIMRHVKSLPADYVILDLGAGVHFNTLDFFGVSDRGIVITAPEPGAVMNAYGFIKAALFRKLQNIFRRHSAIGPIIDAETQKKEAEKILTLDWLTEKIRGTAPDMLPLMDEVRQSFTPVLVVNRIPAEQKNVLVKNLIDLCSNKLGVHLHHLGNLPEAQTISNYLLDIPAFLESEAGSLYCETVEKIKNRLVNQYKIDRRNREVKSDFTDGEISEIIALMEGLDNSIFRDSTRDTWKLRMYFKPAAVVQYLIGRGVSHDAFYESSS